VNWKRMVQVMVVVAALMMAASFPIAAQVPSAGAPGIPANSVSTRPVETRRQLLRKRKAGWRTSSRSTRQIRRGTSRSRRCTLPEFWRRTE